MLFTRYPELHLNTREEPTGRCTGESGAVEADWLWARLVLV